MGTSVQLGAQEKQAAPIGGLAQASLGAMGRLEAPAYTQASAARAAVMLALLAMPDLLLGTCDAAARALDDFAVQVRPTARTQQIGGDRWSRVEYRLRQGARSRYCAGEAMTMGDPCEASSERDLGRGRGLQCTQATATRGGALQASRAVA